MHKNKLQNFLHNSGLTGFEMRRFGLLSACARIYRRVNGPKQAKKGREKGRKHDCLSSKIAWQRKRYSCAINLKRPMQKAPHVADGKALGRKADGQGRQAETNGKRQHNTTLWFLFTSENQKASAKAPSLSHDIEFHGVSFFIIYGRFSHVPERFSWEIRFWASSVEDNWTQMAVGTSIYEEKMRRAHLSKERKCMKWDHKMQKRKVNKTGLWSFRPAAFSSFFEFE